jgi:hypothetical protein
MKYIEHDWTDQGPIAICCRCKCRKVFFEIHDIGMPEPYVYEILLDGNEYLSCDEVSMKNFIE